MHSFQDLLDFDFILISLSFIVPHLTLWIFKSSKTFSIISVHFADKHLVDSPTTVSVFCWHWYVRDKYPTNYSLLNQPSGGSKGGGARDAPPRGPNSFNFMQFLGNFGKIICWRPRGVGAPSSGKSWIRHCNSNLNLNFCTYFKLLFEPEADTHAIFVTSNGPFWRCDFYIPAQNQEHQCFGFFHSRWSYKNFQMKTGGFPLKTISVR